MENACAIIHLVGLSIQKKKALWPPFSLNSFFITHVNKKGHAQYAAFFSGITQPLPKNYVILKPNSIIT